MIVAGHVPHIHADLAVVDLASVATPLTFYPDRMRAPLWETAGIEGDDPIGFPQPINDLSDQHGNQRPMIPRRRADKFLHDQALDSDEGGDLLGILAVQVGQQPLEVEVHVALAGLSLKSMLIGHHEVVQPLYHVVEHVRGNDAIAQQFLSPLFPHRCHLFASSQWHADTGYSLEAIDTTICYMTQRGSKERHTVGVSCSGLAIISTFRTLPTPDWDALSPSRLSVRGLGSQMTPSLPRSLSEKK